MEEQLKILLGIIDSFHDFAELDINIIKDPITNKKINTEYNIMHGQPL